MVKEGRGGRKATRGEEEKRGKELGGKKEISWGLGNKKKEGRIRGKRRGDGR